MPSSSVNIIEGKGVNRHYVVAIPSYKRAEVLKTKTLPILLSINKISPQSIYIFVADKDEKTEYERTIPKEQYNKIIVGKKGISYQRNFIIDYFMEGEKIVFIDDDISKIEVKRNGKVSLMRNMNDFLIGAFETLKKEKKYLWATRNMYNPFYKNLMKEQAVVGMREFSGDFMGIINRKSMKIKLTLEEGEGEQQELLFSYYEKDGGIIKYENVVVVSAKLTPGGKIDERGGREGRIDSLKRNYKKLQQRYGHLIKMITDGDGYRGRAKIIPLSKAKEEKIIKGGKIKDVSIINRDDPNNKNVIVDNIAQTPKVKALQKKVIDLLNKANIPKIDGFKKGEISRGTLLGYKGFTFTLGCGRRRNIPVGEFKSNAENDELMKAVIEYGNEILPTGFDYSVMTINKNLKAKKHKDKGNDGVGCITFLGDYTGGGLYIYDGNEPVLYPTKNKLIAFNGANLAHRTEAFKGDRYAIIYYSQKNKCKIDRFKMIGKGIKEDDYYIDPNTQKVY